VSSEREIELTEKQLDRQVVHRGNFMTFVQDRTVDPDGGLHVRDLVLHPGGVTIVAVLGDRQVLLVRQYRHAVGEALLELPAGTLDRQPDGSLEDRLSAARRELTEETGYRAATWRELATFFTAPGFATELMTLYLATGVTPLDDHPGPDEDERLRLETLTFDEAVAQAVAGTLRDAKTIVGLLLVDELARRGEVAELRASLGSQPGRRPTRCSNTRPDRAGRRDTPGRDPLAR
jgi:ADP-ribose diphosphatase